jgi:hypothetical protein
MRCLRCHALFDSRTEQFVRILFNKIEKRSYGLSKISTKQAETNLLRVRLGSYSLIYLQIS